MPGALWRASGCSSPGRRSGIGRPSAPCWPRARCPGGSGRDGTPPHSGPSSRSPAGRRCSATVRRPTSPNRARRPAVVSRRRVGPGRPRRGRLQRRRRVVGTFETMSPAEIDCAARHQPACPHAPGPRRLPYLRKAWPVASSCSSAPSPAWSGWPKRSPTARPRPACGAWPTACGRNGPATQADGDPGEPRGRGHPLFHPPQPPLPHTWPRPVPVAAVARAIVRAVETRREDVVVPAWLALAARLHGGWPALYRALGGGRRQEI